MDLTYTNEIIDALVTRVLSIEDITLGTDKTAYLARYRGLLRQDLESSYDRLAEWLKPYELNTPISLG